MNDNNKFRNIFYTNAGGLYTIIYVDLRNAIYDNIKLDVYERAIFDLILSGFLRENVFFKDDKYNPFQISYRQLGENLMSTNKASKCVHSLLDKGLIKSTKISFQSVGYCVNVDLIKTFLSGYHAKKDDKENRNEDKRKEQMRDYSQRIREEKKLNEIDKKHESAYEVEKIWGEIPLRKG